MKNVLVFDHRLQKSRDPVRGYRREIGSHDSADAGPELLADIEHGPIPVRERLRGQRRILRNQRVGQDFQRNRPAAILVLQTRGG